MEQRLLDNVDQLQRLRTPMGAVKPMPRFPAVTRDLALLMTEDTPVGPLMSAMEKAGGKLLESVRLFDIYRNPVLGPGMKSVAFSFTFRSADHTLTEGEVNILKMGAYV